MTIWHSFQRLSSWLVGLRCAQAITKVPAKDYTVQRVKAVPGLRRMACQCAWAAARTKNTYLSSQFRRLAARRGAKRAIMAVAHSLIVIVYHLQKNRANYHDLGGNYFDRIHADGLKRYLVKRLQQLGHKVTLEPMEAT